MCYLRVKWKKSRKRCIPLENFEVKVGGVDKKYELQCIIENRGYSVQCGHYMSYSNTSDDSWYEANYTIKTTKITEEFTIQPYK